MPNAIETRIRRIQQDVCDLAVAAAGGLSTPNQISGGSLVVNNNMNVAGTVSFMGPRGGWRASETVTAEQLIEHGKQCIKIGEEIITANRANREV